MAQQVINIGAADAKQGDTLFTGGNKINENFTELYTGIDLLNLKARVLVNSLEDFPAPVSSTITLAPFTQYYVGGDIDLGSNNLAFSDGSVLTGIDSLPVNLNYTGSDPLFNFSNGGARVNRLTISHPNASLFDWSDTDGDHTLRVVDISSSGRDLGTLTGNGSICRFTNFSPELTVNGFTWAGTWRTMLYEPSFVQMSAGFLHNFGVAVFNSVNITQMIGFYLPGSGFLNGAAGSANISAGGAGTVVNCKLGGTGTPLTGISVDDLRWEFHHNDDIQDTLRDSLIYSSSTDTTTITVAETYVKVNATWAEEAASGFSSDSTGRITWNGEKSIKVPVDMSLSVAPDSGTNKTIRTRIALNGVTLANTMRTTRTDSGDASSVTTTWQITFQTGDYIEAFVTTADATNVICSSGIMRVN